MNNYINTLHKNSEGFITVAKMKKHWQQYYFEGINDLSINLNDKDVYISQNTFNNRSRRLTHLKELKALYIDIDCYKVNLSKEAVKALGGVAGDRITINYWTVNSETTFPIIGKSECFGDPTGGNRLTKSNTVSFRGMQRDILLEYGSFFKLVRFNNYFKMEKVDVVLENDLLEEEERDLANLI